MSGLSCHGLRLRLGDRIVLDGVDLALEPGDVTVVVGPNGAGKSTLLSCLAGLQRPDSGFAALENAEILTLPGRRRARRLALLPQNAELAWPLTVEALVGLGRIPHQGPFGPTVLDREAVADALAATGMDRFGPRLVTSLSGGERARALIARALAGLPDWILADEPLTGLDPGHALDALDLLRRQAARGLGVVLTLHDLTLAARFADRVLVLCEGRILSDGPPRQALTPTVLAKAYGVRAEAVETPDGLRLDVQGRL